MMSSQDETAESFLDLLKKKDHLSDVSLRGTDGRQIPAVRVLLAARSPVFERMLYGDFAESTDRVVNLPYTGDVVEKVVAHCMSGSLQIDLPEDCGEVGARSLTILVSAAHFFELEAMEAAALEKSGYLMKKSPPLACALYDEAHAGAAKHEELSSNALAFIHENPDSLCSSELGADLTEDSTGAFFLRSESIVNVFDARLCANELTKFRCLLAWSKKEQEEPQSKKSRALLDTEDLLARSKQQERPSSGETGSSLSREENRQVVAQQLAKHIKLWLVPPSELASVARHSGLVSAETLCDAYEAQALHAEKEGVQFVREHVDVKGAGIRGVNGKYYPDGVCDGVRRYTKKGRINGRAEILFLRRAKAENKENKFWWISAVRESSEIDESSIWYYFVPVVKKKKNSIPSKGWSTLTGGSRLQGIEPSPEVIYMAGWKHP
uniref:BTB domain-containing protein n=1 Tax=Odontella aurita TaxID=265563 RepID=A0A7S4IBN5_9STRA|mmetsp:Transcript_22740/g.67225  ORF Transcript_22740/g.67225 Transcript_22740/m.67225 type:complete len:438 (+) Transcript_22740:916-2229(+)